MTEASVKNRYIPSTSLDDETYEDTTQRRVNRDGKSRELSGDFKVLSETLPC